VITNHGPDDAVGFTVQFSVQEVVNGGLTFVSADVNGQLIQVFPPTQISNTAPPTLSGTATVGSTLTAGNGQWNPAAWPYSCSYHWNRCGVSPAPCQTLDGGPTYTITSADAGCTLQVIVTASSGAGSANAASSPTSPVPGGPCTLSTPQTPSAPTTPVAWMSSLPHATEGQGYLEPMLKNPPTGLEFADQGGSIPRGFSITPDGELTGRAFFSGSYTFTVGARLDGYAYNNQQFTLVIDPPRATAAAQQIRASRSLTPGARNPKVTELTIRSTICSTSWLRRQQPPAAYLRTVKLQQIRRYHDSGTAARYDEDELIPIDLGGAGRNPANLWPEPAARAHTRNRLERQLNRQVCAGTLNLTTAQERIVRVKRALG
jgi:hypothetical protein